MSNSFEHASVSLCSPLSLSATSSDSARGSFLSISWRTMSAGRYPAEAARLDGGLAEIVLGGSAVHVPAGRDEQTFLGAL